MMAVTLPAVMPLVSTICAQLARLFHHTSGSHPGAIDAADDMILEPNQATQAGFFDLGTHSPFPPLFIRAGDGTLAAYPVLNALATCAKMF